MPPRRQNPIEPNPNQPALLSVGLEVTPRGVGKAAIVGVHPDGITGEEAEAVMPAGMRTVEEVAANAIAEALKTKHRREAQQGNHSPLLRDGHYGSICVSDYLPALSINDKPFGPVTYKNWGRAVQHAWALEEQRRADIRREPTLDIVSSDVLRIMDGRPDDERSRAPTKPIKLDEENLPRLDTLRARLEAVTEDAKTNKKAPRYPMSKLELTTTLALDSDIAESLANGGSGRGVTHNHFRETYISTQNRVQNIKKFPKAVADWYADRAFASRCYEMIDFFGDAIQSVDWLDDFADTLSEALNPAQKEAVINGDYHPAMGVLVGFLTVAKLEAGAIAENELPFSPLTHQEDRTRRVEDLPTLSTKIDGSKITTEELKSRIAEISQQVKNGTGVYSEDAKFGRNKTIIMPFTNPNMSDEAKRFIQAAVADIPIGQLGALIRVARESSMERAEYSRQRLEDISGKYKKIVSPTLLQHPRANKVQ